LSNRNPILEGRFLEIEVKDCKISPHEIGTFGFELVYPINNTTGEPFPDCCGMHKKVKETILDWYKSFPKDCNEHKALLNDKSFAKEKYTYLPNKTLISVFATEQMIEHYHNDPDWFGYITEYFDYCVGSYGFPRVGAKWYLLLVRHLINEMKTSLYGKKKDQILDFIKFQYFTPHEVPMKVTSLTLLESIYQKWISSIPHSLPFFVGLKERLQNHFPFIKKEVKSNRYTGLAVGQIHSEDSLLQYLEELTSNLLRSVNLASLLETGQIKDIEATQFKVAKASLKTSNEKLLSDYTKGELKYMETIEKWLEIQLAFFKNVERIPISKILPSGQTKPKIPAKYYSLYHWILIDQGKEKPLPKDENGKWDKKAIEAFSKNRYPETSTQQFYNGIRDIDITNKIAIANSFGKGYKEKVIEISNNDIEIITYLKNWPN